MNIEDMDDDDIQKRINELVHAPIDGDPMTAQPPEELVLLMKEQSRRRRERAARDGLLETLKITHIRRPK